jgi:hypothetical protein
MESNNNNLEALKEFFYNEFQIEKSKINKDTSLLYDLEITGDDIDDVFSRLVKQFNIHVKRLDLSRFYVGDEPADLISPIVRFFRREDISKKPTITIADIGQFIQTGVLE